MNILLYLTLLVLVMLFVYCLFVRESFTQTYDQNYEFVARDNYKYDKDSKFISQFDNYLALGESEYKNLRQKLEDKNKYDKDIDVKDINTRNIKYIQNLNRLPNYPLIKRELSLIEFDDILTKIKYNPDYKYNNDISHFKEVNMDKNLLYSFNLIKEWIIEKISMVADEELYKMEFINNERFLYIEDQLLSYKVDYENHLEHFIFKMRVYRKNKLTHFIIYFDMILDNYNQHYYVNDLIILGSDIQENIEFSKFKRNHFKLADKFNSNINIDKKKLDSFLKQKQKKQIHEYDTNYCFFKNAKDRNDCISISKNKNSIGIYDSQCLYNEDCPFYKKNNNYPNSRGGCKKGYCEMPTNIKLVGYKEYISGNNAICYNCNKTDDCSGIECNMCCEQQKDPKLYPNLEGPDYSYPNDYNERIKHSKSFEQKNMTPISLIV